MIKLLSVWFPPTLFKPCDFHLAISLSFPLFVSFLCPFFLLSPLSFSLLSISYRSAFLSFPHLYFLCLSLSLSSHLTPSCSIEYEHVTFNKGGTNSHLRKHFWRKLGPRTEEQLRLKRVSGDILEGGTAMITILHIIPTWF